MKKTGTLTPAEQETGVFFRFRCEASRRTTPKWRGPGGRCRGFQGFRFFSGFGHARRRSLSLAAGVVLGGAGGVISGSTPILSRVGDPHKTTWRKKGSAIIFSEGRLKEWRP